MRAYIAYQRNRKEAQSIYSFNIMLLTINALILPGINDDMIFWV